MKESEIREQIVKTGRQLLENELVARTWGNVSARLGENNFLITPSGMDYNTMRSGDIVHVDAVSGEWEGKYKPSGEKGIHMAAYEVYSDVNFAIHTHQTYATALSLAGFSQMEMSEDEKARLGGVALADYGLSGTKRLSNAVERALESGAKVVLMPHHGTLICGDDCDDTMEKAMLLEEICKRSCKGQPQDIIQADEGGKALIKKLKKDYPYIDILQTPQAVMISQKGVSLTAQLDDMAQMIGRRAPAIFDESKVSRALKTNSAVIVPGLGIIARADDDSDLEALMILMQKAAITKLHTDALNDGITLGRAESALMHFVYKKKYSKQKKKGSHGREKAASAQNK